MAQIVWALLMSATLAAAGTPVLDGSKPLTSAKVIHELKRDEAARGLPVLLRGAIVYCSPRPPMFVLQENETSIYVRPARAAVKDASGADVTTQWKIGMVVEVQGTTAPGSYDPIIVAREIRVLGSAPLPPPRTAGLEEILTGAMCMQRLELTGVVQSATPPKTSATASMQLQLAVPGETFLVTVIDSKPWRAEQLVGATVRLRAVCFQAFNARAEPLGTHFHTFNLDEMTILAPAPADPFAAPEISINRLIEFSASGASLARKRITGMVSFYRPGQFLYLEEQGRAVRVNTPAKLELVLGDRVEVSGFVDVMGNFAELNNAAVRKLGRGDPPAPLEPTLQEIYSASHPTQAPAFLHEDYYGRLVAMRGRLDLVERPDANTRRLLFTCEGQSIAAMLVGPQVGLLDDLRLGSEIRASGLCLVQFSAERPTPVSPKPSGVSLLLRSAADVRVLRAASWWTAQRLFMLAGGTGATLVLALGWIGLLKRQVTLKGAQLTKETRARHDAAVEFRATLSERERLAADLHDTTQQVMTGLALQLETAEALQRDDPNRSARHLGLARQLLARSREELRRSIWNLRSHMLEGCSLTDALRDVARSHAADNVGRIEVTCDGAARSLPNIISGNLLLLTQEALTNAIKHAMPRKITVHLTHAATAVSLTIQDDGAGFDPDHSPGLAEGHFGLQGMRERMKRLGGTLAIISAPGQGTTITAEVPLPDAAASKES